MFKLKISLIITGFLLYLICNTEASNLNKKSVEDWEQIVSAEFHARDGLPNFFAKVLCGDSIRVGYLGGSITEQNGWRIFSLNWLKQRFPTAKFTEINAAIGGTGSDFGVFRLYDHVLKYKPDLVFVEFAVNDGSTSPEKIIRSMEGIVRQTWQYNRTTDICFIYTIANSFLAIEQSGQLPESASTMEKLAEKYHVPSINFGFEIARQEKDGQLIFKNESKELNGIKVFSPDGVHPFPETGHKIYQEVFQRSFEKMIPERSGHPQKHILGRSMAPDYFSHAQMIDVTKARLSKNWEVIQIKDNPSFSAFGRYLQNIGKANQTGETLEIHFKGQAIGFSDIMGPDAGRVIVEIDGEVKDTLFRFDRYCTYRRISYFLMDHLEYKHHTVIFRALTDPFDKTAILAKKEDISQNPDKFNEYAVLVGKILIDGKMEY